MNTVSLSLPLTVPDAVCVDDLDPNGNETTSDLQTLAQDVYHILLEAPGSNPDDPARGIGLEGYLSGTTVDLGLVPRIIDAELRKDARIDSSSSTLVLNDDGSYSLNIAIDVNGSVLPLGFVFTQVGGLVQV
jgi:hypothetical protein